MRLLLSFVVLAFGMVAALHPFWFVRTFGHIRWAEQHLGGGGSYPFWRLVGVGCILAGFLLLRFGESLGL